MTLQSAEEYLKRKKKHGEAYEFDHKCEVISVFYAATIMQEYAKLYATEKVKEALKLAAERSTVVFHDGTTKKETHHIQINTGNNHIRVGYESMKSLETELIESINKEK